MIDTLDAIAWEGDDIRRFIVSVVDSASKAAVYVLVHTMLKLDMTTDADTKKAKI